MLKHATIRLYLFFLLALFILTLGLSMFILAPVYKHAFAPKARYRDVRPLRVWVHVWRVVWRSLSQKSYRDMYPSKLTDPPQNHNDLNVVCISDTWQGAHDNCDVCESTCCDQLNCPLVHNKRCICYGSWYWGYYYCGRYPSNQAQIDYYNCPKWVTIKDSEEGRENETHST